MTALDGDVIASVATQYWGVAGSRKERVPRRSNDLLAMTPFDDVIASASEAILGYNREKIIREKMEIKQAKYKDVKSIELYNDNLKVVVLPEFGSKIVSIYYLPKSYELLWQNDSQIYKKSKFGDLFESGEFSGIDEMFPSISKCYYEEYPWQGIEVPDHGELWSIPWNYQIDDKSKNVNLWVNGIRFPYLFEKRVSINKNKVKISYSIENKSPFDMDYIWALHPLFNTSHDMSIVVPDGMDKIINSVAGPTLNEYGKIYDFPMATLGNGKRIDLSIIPEKNTYGYQKYYFLGKVKEGWCKVIDNKKGISITLNYPKEKVPYLGIWVNEGGWGDQYNIALEPATGAMDRVDVAKLWGMNSVLKPYEIFKWNLEILIDSLV